MAKAVSRSVGYDDHRCERSCEVPVHFVLLRLRTGEQVVGGEGGPEQGNLLVFFFQAEDGIRDLIGLEFRRVLFRSEYCPTKQPATWPMRRKKSCRPSKALSKNKSSGRTSMSSAPTAKEEIQGRTSNSPNFIHELDRKSVV